MLIPDVFTQRVCVLQRVLIATTIKTGRRVCAVARKLICTTAHVPGRSQVITLAICVNRYKLIVGYMDHAKVIAVLMRWLVIDVQRPLGNNQFTQVLEMIRAITWFDRMFSVLQDVSPTQRRWPLKNAANLHNRHGIQRVITWFGISWSMFTVWHDCTDNSEEL